mmetsp:Transcript_24701/g.82617  ORF Transcript_24701/g.82617 Transcript_24701/m.82617 type:complete len:148 (+) Transcript_24701:100-543(+)
MTPRRCLAKWFLLLFVTIILLAPPVLFMVIYGVSMVTLVVVGIIMTIAANSTIHIVQEECLMQPSLRNSGLTKDIIDEMCPARSGGTSSTDESCVVCLQPIDGTELQRTLSCGHSYHAECIDRWWLSTPGPMRCPTCRQQHAPPCEP